MKRRLLCLLCAVMLLIPALVSAEGAAPEGCSSYDFDLTFKLNANAFPRQIRTRMAGYSQLIDRIGLRGNAAWSTVTQSFELDAVLYFTDNPTLSYPFRIFGAQPRIFITSPLLRDEVILLNMAALLEFAVKAKKTLGIPLPYLAYLYPFTTEYAMSGPYSIWHNVIGSYVKSGKITSKQLKSLAEHLAEEFINNSDLIRWITTLADGSDNAHDAVEAELLNIPDYIKKATDGYKPISVVINDHSQTWKTAKGQTLFSCLDSDNSYSLSLTLPATENHYIPYFVYSRESQNSSVSFNLETSLNLDPYNTVTNPVPDIKKEHQDTYIPYSEYDEDEIGFSDDESDEYSVLGPYDDIGETSNLQAIIFPDSLLHLVIEATNLPVSFPSDSAFRIMINLQEKLFPNVNVIIQGETKTNGSLILSILKQDEKNNESKEAFRCEGTIVKASARDIPDYMQMSLDGVYNVFSFNEISLANFRRKVMPSLIHSVISFVAEAPTAACQSLLDDLSDSGILDMVMMY